MGDWVQTAQKAKALLKEHEIEVVKTSSKYQTEPWGNVDQDPFTNEVWCAKCAYSPEELMFCLLKIESMLGRVRSEKVKWAPRTIDMDILYYGSEIMDTPILTVPHPRIAERKFVLIPLVEIAPDFIHPVLGVSSKELLNVCQDTSEVKKL